MSTTPDPDDTLRDLLSVLELNGSDARTSEDIFTGSSQAMPHGRVFGGQVLAQSSVAASRTIPTDRALHSMHGYFLRPGDATKGITFAVDRIHDGRSFSTRRTQAYQEGVPIFSMIASFQVDDPGLDHHKPMPQDVPLPEDLPSLEARTAALPEAERWRTMHRPIELRHVEAPVYFDPDPTRSPSQAVWVRTRGRLPDDPVVHRAAMAYLSDMTVQESILRAHGIAWATPGLRVASLDHAMWWHRAGRADQWMLYVQESPSAQGGRGLATGRLYSREGVLLASVAQEIMVRVPRDRGDD